MSTIRDARIKENYSILEDGIRGVELKFPDNFSGNNAMVLNFISITSKWGFAKGGKRGLLNDVSGVHELITNESFVVFRKIGGDLIDWLVRITIDYGWR
mmetsp:Transcript_26016/g.49504  ORF Transcript_26016/g.49504 Transcript_26016/m.49504 type:complete len:99 (+) Transcript_26016:100-396(+)